METNKVNSVTGTKRVSLSEGTFRIFAKSVRDATSNQSNRSGSSTKTSSSNESSPYKDGDSPLSEGKKMSDESVFESPENGKSPENLSSGSSSTEINKMDSQQKPSKSRRSIGIELENLKENCPVTDVGPSLEEKKSLPKDGGNEMSGRLEKLTSQSNVIKPVISMEVNDAEPKTSNVDQEGTKPIKSPPDKSHSAHTPLVPYNQQRYNQHRRYSYDDSTILYQHQHQKPSRHRYPDFPQPHRPDSYHSMDQRSHGRPNQHFEKERRYGYIDRNLPPRFRPKRFSETDQQNIWQDQEDWNNDLLDVKEKLDDQSSVKCLSTSLPDKTASDASALNISCPELDQVTEVPNSSSDVDNTKEQGNIKQNVNDIHSHLLGHSHFESGTGETESGFDNEHILAAPETKQKSNELSDLIDRCSLDTNKTTSNLLKNDKYNTSDAQERVKNPVVQADLHINSVPEDFDAVSSTIVQAIPEKNTLEDGLKLKIPYMTTKCDAVDNTEDWSDELTEVLTPAVDVGQDQDGMDDHKQSHSAKHIDPTKCSDTGNDSVLHMSDLQGSINSNIESELNWAGGWTSSKADTSSSDVTGISIEEANQDISDISDAGEKVLISEICISSNLEKSMPRAGNQAVVLRNIESKDSFANTEDVLPETNSNQPIVSLQDGVPRMKAIFARGGIRPSPSSRGAHSFHFTERSSTALDKDIIKPHPLMTFPLEGNWEKVFENDIVEPEEEEIFDSEVKTPPNVDQTLEISKDPNNNLKGTTDMVPGNVAPQFSQDIRRKASVNENKTLIGPIQNQNAPPPNVYRPPFDGKSEHSESIKYSRPHVQRRNSQTPPLRTRNDEKLDAELKKIDDYLGLTKHPKKPEHHASSHKKHGRPRTHSYTERPERSERRGFKSVKSLKSDKSNKSEDWSSDLLDIQSAPVEPRHFTEKLHDGSSNSFQNISNYSNKSGTIPIPDNSLMNIDSNYSPNLSVDVNQRKETSPQRSHPNEKAPSPQKIHPNETRSNSQGRDSGTNQFDNSKNNDSKNFKHPDVQNESVQSSKEFSIDRELSGDKHEFLTSSKMSTSNKAVAISDAFSDFSSVGSDDDVLQQTDPKIPSAASISMKRKHLYRYSSQDMSISSRSADPRYQKTPKAEICDMDYRKKSPMPPNPLEYPYYHPGQSPPGPPFDPRLFNPYIPFYPPYMYPPYYPGYENNLMEQHQKIEEERHNIKKERNKKDKDPDKESVKKEGKDSDQPGQVPNLSHLITVPLNKITDLEQAQLLLQFVDQLVRKVPHASGAYYRAVSNQGEPSLEVGATIDPSPQNKNKTKSPTKSHPSSSHKHQRRASAPNDGSAMKPHYQYQTRYQPAQFNPMESLQYSHQDLPSQIFEYPDAALKTTEDTRYHDYRNYYINQNQNKDQSNMDDRREPQSPSPSLVNYDITDDDDYYEDTDKNVREVIGPRDPLNDRRNIICNKLKEDSDNQKPMELYHQEFPELGRSVKGPKRIVSDTDTSFRKVIERDIAAKEVFDQKQTNIRYVPPHKRRFSEYGENRPMTKFGALNAFEEENRNPYEVWQKYMKSSPTDSDKNTTPITANYRPNNWRQKTDPEESYPAKFSNIPPTYPQEEQKLRRRYSNGQIPESLVNDAKLYRDPYRPYSDQRAFDSSTPGSSMDSISSKSSYSTRLQNDNRLNNDATHRSSFNQMWKIRFKERSKSYQITFIDSHCHIDLLYERLNFNGTYKEFLQRFSDCYPSNFAGCIAIFCYPRHFQLNGLWKKLAEEEDVWISIGCHPKNAIQYNEMVEENMLKILKHPKVVALGEIGLDYFGNQKQFENLQKTVFRRQLKIGLEVKKPIVIHCRDAEDDCLQIMEEIIPRNYKIQCHCFSGNYSQAKRWLSAFPNLYLGLTPVVTFNGAHAAHDVARNIPLDRLLLETDSPYFVPKPLIKEEQVISLPGFALTVAEDVAHRRGIPVQEVLSHCRDNMTSLFGI